MSTLFSVGSLNKRAGGLKGKKGVLWYEIQRILKHNKKQGFPTKYVLLENVDRLLKCPVNIKGADFTKILQQLNSLEYAVEWKVINAGDYNMPQRRRRVFILCYQKGTDIYEKIISDNYLWLTQKGVLASAFKSKEYNNKRDYLLKHCKNYIQDRMRIDKSKFDDKTYYNEYMKHKKIPSLFDNSGLMINGNIITAKHVADKKENKNPLRNFLESNDSKIGEEFLVSKEEYLEKWRL